ncbi:MAG TPA: malto-oligosyltrehalose trehalohydrolase [Tepidisphaeraceae bacterium]
MNSTATATPPPRQKTAPQLGAIVTPEGVTFRLWSTKAHQANVVLYDNGREDRRPLRAVGDGVFEGAFPDVRPGARYKFDIGGPAFPDPYARWLPEGPHGPGVVWQSSFDFAHKAPVLRRDELVIYEIHVGTFTPEGTYRAAAAKLPHLKELGITCIEMMPVSTFPGERGWGYDGVAHFAPFARYGPPEDLQAFVDQAHGLGIAVLLDMVYNHFGPDANYLSAYSPEYFTKVHKTPWGDALDYTNPFMRRLAVDSAEHWLRTFRFDGFRLDATHEIHDESEPHFLEELAGRVHGLREELGTPHFLFCEDDRNWPGLVSRFHMDGMWADDFHHQTRILLTGERDGYFAAYEPTVAALAKCIERGWTYEGQTWTVGGNRQRGNPADGLAASSFVYTIQNHDQIGNRALGDRLQVKAGEDGFLAASALLMFLPMTPLMFQGQEWMASTPFLYFSDHAGPLGEAVTKGRTSEFGHFEDFRNGKTKVPDPQAASTFTQSKLDWSEPARGRHAEVLALYKKLIHLRRTDPVLIDSSRENLTAGAAGDVLWVQRRHGGQMRVLLVNFGKAPVTLDNINGVDLGTRRVLLATSTAQDGLLPVRGAIILE